MPNLFSDMRYAFRNLFKSPSFTAVAIITLAIGIGANTAIFSIIDNILLRPLPYRDPGRLVRLYETESAPGHYPFAGADYLDWKAQNRSLQDMTLYGWPHDLNLSGEGRLDHVLGTPTEGNFFSLLGVRPLLGRTWAPGEDRAGKDQVAILSYGLWRSRFAGDPDVIGHTVALNSKKYVIVGVMPPSFRFPARTELWFPQDMDPKTLGPHGSHWASAIGRLKPGVTVAAAQADLALIAAQLEKRLPGSNYKVGAAVVPLHDDLVGESRDSLIMMLSAVGLLLLIACANIANLLLSRAVARQKEMAIRSALGAARKRLVGQLLTESVLLGVSGGAVGLGLAWAIIAMFSATKSFALPQFSAIQLNGAVLVFAFALSIATGILFGVVPALQTSRPDVHEELKGGAGSLISPGRSRRFASNALVVGEIALSLLLLVCAGLLLEDFVRLRALDIGVRPDGVWTAAIRLPDNQYKTQQDTYRFAQALLNRAQRIHGVDAAALSNRLPLEGGSNGYVKVRGRVTQNMSGPLVETHAVSPDYFRAMGIKILKGRVFTDADVQEVLQLDQQQERIFKDGAKPSPDVTNAMIFPAIINEAMAREFWPNENPVGALFSFGSDNGPWKQVIGVVNDVRQWGLTKKAQPEAYDAFDGDGRLLLVLHTSMDPASVTPDVRRTLAEVDSSLPLFSVRTMDDVIAEHAQGQQFLSVLVGSFAGIALILAAVGIYGVLSYAVTQRTREIGIRMSLGASRSQVLQQVLKEGMRLALFGFAAGLAGAYAASKVMASLLHEVKPGDPTILFGTALLLAAVALAACYVPARRAARLDPMVALRYE